MMPGASVIPAALRRSVVLHADDFGMNSAVTRGIIRGFTHGLLTSTSLLANAPDRQQAVAAWRGLQASVAMGEIPSAGIRRRLGDASAPFDLGIHLNLTQGRPLTGSAYPKEFLDSDGRFPGIFKLFRAAGSAAQQSKTRIAAELEAQVEFLVDQGIAPTHLNGHQYIELIPLVTSLVPGLLQRYGIPAVRVAHEDGLLRTTLLRRFQPANWFLARVKRSFAAQFRSQMRRLGIRHPESFFGTSHAGHVDLGLMREFLKNSRGGVTEIGLHPGLKPIAADRSAASRNPPAIDDGWNDPLANLRESELNLICSQYLTVLLEAHAFTLGRLAELPSIAVAA